MLSRTLPALVTVVVALAGCDSGSSTCGPAPSSAARGSFAFQFEEESGCFTLQGANARFGVQQPVYSDSSTTYALLIPDDGDESDETTTLVQFVAVGSRPLPVGAYDLADLYTRSSVEYAPPAGDARLIEHPGKVSLAAVIARNEIAFSRGGTLTVTRSGPDGYAGRFDATLAVEERTGLQDRPGATLHLRGAFDVEPGARGAYIIN